MTDLEQFLAGFGERPDASAMLRLQDAAEGIAREDGPEAAQKLPSGTPTFTQGWFKAALLERVGRVEESLETLETLETLMMISRPKSLPLTSMLP